MRVELWALRLLLLFHLVLVGARVRIGPLPIESFFVVWLLVVALLWRHISLRKLDTISLILLALIAIRVLATGLDLARHGDHRADRIYFSMHRMLPLVGFLLLYSARLRLLALGALGIVEKALAAGILLHGLATLVSVISEPAMLAVVQLGSLMEATSARSQGGTFNVYADNAYYGAVYRVSGLLKYPTVNAGFLATLGSLAACLYYRTRRTGWLSLFIVSVFCCLLTFSRGGLGALALAWLVMIVLELRSGGARRILVTSAALGAGSFLITAVLGAWRSGAFMEIATNRFSQFFEVDQFDSAQTKLAATSQFFHVLTHKYLVLLYPGFGLNDFLLYWRGEAGFDEAGTGFVSNAWLLFAYDCSIYYLLLLVGLLVALFRRFARGSPTLAIVVVPLIFVVASDHFFATTLEMHSLLWVLLGITTLYLERDRRAARQVPRA